MPPATFATPESKIAFYEKYNEKLTLKYHTDPEYRAKVLESRKKRYEESKLNGKAELKKQKRREKYLAEKEKIKSLSVCA